MAELLTPRLRGLALTAAELHGITAWPEPLIEDYLNIFYNLGLISGEVDNIVIEAGAIETITSNTLLTAEQEAILVDAAHNDVTVTLPDPAANEGKRYCIKRIDDSGNRVTVHGVIDGETFKEICFQWSAMQLKCDGGGWFIL